MGELDLSTIYFNVFSDMKTSFPIFEDFISKSVKLNSSLNSLSSNLTGFLEALQKIADLATRAQGATQQIGKSLTRLCMREKILNANIKTMSNELNNQILVKLRDLVSEWKTQTGQLDKDRAKCLKKAKSDWFKASNKAISLQNKIKFDKRNSMRDLQTKAESCIRMTNHTFENFENVERLFARKMMTEERSRYCALFECLRPALQGQMAIVNEMSILEEILEQLQIQTLDKDLLPSQNEEIILNAASSFSNDSASKSGVPMIANQDNISIRNIKRGTSMSGSQQSISQLSMSLDQGSICAAQMIQCMPEHHPDTLTADLPRSGEAFTHARGADRGNDDGGATSSDEDLSDLEFLPHYPAPASNTVSNYETGDTNRPRADDVGGTGDTVPPGHSALREHAAHQPFKYQKRLGNVESFDMRHTISGAYEKTSMHQQATRPTLNTILQRFDEAQDAGRRNTASSVPGCLPPSNAISIDSGVGGSTMGSTMGGPTSNAVHIGPPSPSNSVIQQPVTQDSAGNMTLHTLYDHHSQQPNQSGHKTPTLPTSSTFAKSPQQPQPQSQTHPHPQVPSSITDSPRINLRRSSGFSTAPTPAGAANLSHSQSPATTASFHNSYSATSFGRPEPIPISMPSVLTSPVASAAYCSSASTVSAQVNSPALSFSPTTRRTTLPNLNSSSFTGVAQTPTATPVIPPAPDSSLSPPTQNQQHQQHKFTQPVHSSPPPAPTTPLISVLGSTASVSKNATGSATSVVGDGHSTSKITSSTAEQFPMPAQPDDTTNFGNKCEREIQKLQDALIEAEKTFSKNNIASKLQTPSKLVPKILTPKPQKSTCGSVMVSTASPVSSSNSINNSNNGNNNVGGAGAIGGTTGDGGIETFPSTNNFQALQAKFNQISFISESEKMKLSERKQSDSKVEATSSIPSSINVSQRAKELSQQLSKPDLEETQFIGPAPVAPPPPPQPTSSNFNKSSYASANSATASYPAPSTVQTSSPKVLPKPNHTPTFARRFDALPNQQASPQQQNVSNFQRQYSLQMNKTQNRPFTASSRTDSQLQARQHQFTPAQQSPMLASPKQHHCQISSFSPANQNESLIQQRKASLNLEASNPGRTFSASPASPISTAFQRNKSLIYTTNPLRSTGENATNNKNESITRHNRTSSKNESPSLYNMRKSSNLINNSQNQSAIHPSTISQSMTEPNNYWDEIDPELPLPPPPTE